MDAPSAITVIDKTAEATDGTADISPSPGQIASVIPPPDVPLSFLIARQRHRHRKGDDAVHRAGGADGAGHLPGLVEPGKVLDGAQQHLQGRAHRPRRH